MSHAEPSPPGAPGWSPLPAPASTAPDAAADAVDAATGGGAEDVLAADAMQRAYDRVVAAINAGPPHLALVSATNAMRRSTTVLLPPDYTRLLVDLVVDRTKDEDHRPTRTAIKVAIKAAQSRQRERDAAAARQRHAEAVRAAAHESALASVGDREAIFAGSRTSAQVGALGARLERAGFFYLRDSQHFILHRHHDDMVAPVTAPQLATELTEHAVFFNASGKQLASAPQTLLAALLGTARARALPVTDHISRVPLVTSAGELVPSGVLHRLSNRVTTALYPLARYLAPPNPIDLPDRNTQNAILYFHARFPDLPTTALLPLLAWMAAGIYQPFSVEPAPIARARLVAYTPADQRLMDRTPPHELDRMLADALHLLLANLGLDDTSAVQDRALVAFPHSKTTAAVQVAKRIGAISAPVAAAVATGPQAHLDARVQAAIQAAGKPFLLAAQNLYIPHAITIDLPISWTPPPPGDDDPLGAPLPSLLMSPAGPASGFQGAVLQRLDRATASLFGDTHPTIAITPPLLSTLRTEPLQRVVLNIIDAIGEAAPTDGFSFRDLQLAVGKNHEDLRAYEDAAGNTVAAKIDTSVPETQRKILAGAHAARSTAALLKANAAPLLIRSRPQLLPSPLEHLHQDVMHLALGAAPRESDLPGQRALADAFHRSFRHGTIVYIAPSLVPKTDQNANWNTRIGKDPLPLSSYPAVWRVEPFHQPLARGTEHRYRLIRLE